MKKINNPYLAQQCINLQATLANFRAGIKLAALKNDGIIDSDETKLLNEINKELDKIKKMLEKYEFT